MPKITFLPSQKTVQVQAGTSLFDAAQQAGLPVASSCTANFICGKCNVQILSNDAELSAQTPEEVELLKREGHPPTDRIACKTLVKGDCSFTTRYW